MAIAKAPAKRKTAKKPATRKVTPKQETTQTVERDDAQWAATIEAYATLKTANVPIPAEIAEPVERWLAEQQKSELAALKAQEAQKATEAEQDAAGPKWVRNCYGAPFSLRLQRQDKKQRIELKPRGLRGDMFPLEPGDEHDHILISNLGFVEVIGDGAAKKIAAGQTHNIQKTNTTLAMITNEVGDPINKLTVETEYNKQGVVVGYIDPNARPKDAFGGIKRPGETIQPEQVSHFVPTGGNPAIISQGYLTDNAKAAVADKLARLKGVQGRPEEVLGLTVSVDPVRSA